MEQNGNNVRNGMPISQSGKGYEPVTDPHIGVINQPDTMIQSGVYKITLIPVDIQILQSGPLVLVSGTRGARCGLPIHEKGTSE
ncbi:hypothetical protein CEXT_380731 [Caerostris extrusa]|uniref:Uncharacterized protein n=1 Tax=Caerostris extrusa TaxID=172846 RepID=A0AAV4TM93_CAEEX|nr:hypothetical protein CEXT_380731 [Caerostris extrusa]